MNNIIFYNPPSPTPQEKRLKPATDDEILLTGFVFEVFRGKIVGFFSN